MNLDKYHFLSSIDKLNNFCKSFKFENSSDTFLDYYVDICTAFNTEHFLVDTLPMRMDDSFMVTHFFNTHSSNEAGSCIKGFEFDFYFSKYFKIILMLVGYNAKDDAFFESSLFFKNDNEIIVREILTDNFIRRTYRNDSKVFSLKTDFDIFMLILDKSIRELCDLMIYLPKLKIIVKVEGLLLNCLVFDNVEFLDNMVKTEGLYLRKLSEENF